MKLPILLAAVLGMTGLPGRAAPPARILIGEPPAPVVAGEVWLIANRWGAYPGLLVGTIRNGELEVRENVEFPRYWEQAFDYKVLVAVSSRPVEMPQSLSEDSAYVAFSRSEYLKRFPVIYLSPPLPARNLGKDWEDALQEIGRPAGNTLVLPPPIRRTLRLVYPDGRTLAGTELHVSLFGSGRNHCGVAVGIDLGGFTTDANGEISFVATNSSLARNRGYFAESTGGPAGTMFTAMDDVILDGGQHITVKRLWTLPTYDYVLRLRTRDNRPVVHACLTACDNFDGCGVGCGPLAMGTESDESGVIAFHSQDLRELRTITVVGAAGQKRNLTNPEMRELLTAHRLHLTW